MSDGPAPGELWTAARSAAADRHTMTALGVPSPVLMERAALCVSAEVEAMLAVLGDRAGVLLLCGPGNNGGDGFAVARQLHMRGRKVRALALGDRRNAEAEAQRQLAARCGVELIAGGIEGLPATLAEPMVIVDALLGTGSKGAPRGAIAAAIEWLRRGDGDGEGGRGRVRVVAVDLPSGVDVDTGAVAAAAVRADVTVTFQRSKPGLHLTPGRAWVGQVVVADIGLADQPDAQGESLTLIEPSMVAEALASLPAAAHKGRRGHVGVVGGTGGTPGAAILAGAAALRSGAGLATLAATDPALREALIRHRPELMLTPIDAGETAAIPGADVLVVGPGLTIDEPGARARLLGIFAGDPRPQVWDAGGLASIAEGPAVSGAPAGPRILTPHPGEAARMLSILDGEPWTNARVQADRRGAAERLAAACRATVVLKGEGTVVAALGHLAIATTGGPALATAGSGDVLAGTIAALLARGLDAWTAACVGVHVHGLAGDRSPTDGALAMDIADALPQALAFAAAGEAPPSWPRWRRG